MPQSRTVLANGPEIIAARMARGFTTPEELAKETSDLDIMSLDTLRRCEDSPDPPHTPFRTKLEALAKYLGTDLDRFTLKKGPIAPGVRSCAGCWDVAGKDIVVPDHFVYPNGPKGLTARVIVKTHGDTVIAEGEDHDRDHLSFFGYLREHGNHVVGHYTVKNEKLHVYGTVNLHFESCGNRLNGFYMGRDTGHGSTFILGKMTMTRTTGWSALPGRDVLVP